MSVRRFTRVGLAASVVAATSAAFLPFPYLFSYSTSYAMTSDLGKVANRGATPRVTAISRPAEKILVVEQNELSINDGLWEGGSYTNANTRTGWEITPEFLSVRHDIKKEEFADLGTFDGFLHAPAKRGNVLFVDGHAELVSRLYAQGDGLLTLADAVWPITGVTGTSGALVAVSPLGHDPLRRYGDQPNVEASDTNRASPTPKVSEC